LVAERQGAGSRLRVLAAEDNPVIQTVLQTMLTWWGYQPVVARDGLEAWEILQQDDAPHLALVDWMMPGLDGVELCRRVRATGREPYTYILLLTARTESQDLVEGMNAGADDYLTKPFNAHELRARLRAGTRIIQLQEQLLQAREALRHQAMHDGLTGLLNHAAILEALDNELARAGREDQPLSLMIADLDRFKQINDTYGHLVGDIVLREAARRMKASIRRYDSIGRYGGEEFLIVLAGCEGESARTQAERIREAISSEPFAVGDSSVLVTCSIGVSSRDRNDPVDGASLMREADQALYLAKKSGRNRVAMAGDRAAA
jgi:two-component system cell cycle response regulator